MIKAIVKKIIFGREYGFRAKIFSQIFRAEDTSPNSSFSAPSHGENQRPQFEHEGANVSSEKEAPKDFTPPDGFEVVCHIDSVREGEIKEFIIAGEAICLTKVEDSIFAFSNDCPHAGAPLSEGSCKKGQVACAYHGWVFEIETGECLTNPGYSIDTYNVFVEQNAVCVQI